MAPSYGHTHCQCMVVFVSSSAAAAGVVGTSNILDADMDAHVIDTNDGDDGVTDGVVTLEQDANVDLVIGGPLVVLVLFDDTHHTRAKHILTPRAVLAALPLHINYYPCDIFRPKAPGPIAISVTTKGVAPSREPDISQLR
ncbi:hypothetical protein ACEPAG_8442 [Sanghuangporus baumii]